MGRYSKYDPRSGRRRRDHLAMQRAARLRLARAGAGYDRAVDAARHFGWVKATYYSHENGWASFGGEQLAIYAAAFGVDENWLGSGGQPGKGEGGHVRSKE